MIRRRYAGTSMEALFQHLTMRRYKMAIGAVVLVAIAVGFVTSWMYVYVAEQAGVTAARDRLTVKTRATAQSLQSAISLLRAELVTLATYPEIETGDIPQARKLLNLAVAAADHPAIRQISLTSRAGTLLILANKEKDTKDEGISLVDRSYYLWAKRARPGAFFVSEPLVPKAGINRGKQSLVAATPVFQNGQFNGVLHTSISIEDLTINYLNALKTPSEKTIASYVIDEHGVTIATPFTDLIGVNVRSYARDKRWPGYETYLSMVDAMTSGREGSRVYVFMSSDGVTKRWINAFSPVSLGQSFFSIASAVPYTQAETLVNDIYTIRLVSLGIVLLFTTIGVFLLFFGLYVAQYEGYNRGLKDGYHLKKKPSSGT